MNEATLSLWSRVFSYSSAPCLRSAPLAKFSFKSKLSLSPVFPPILTIFFSSLLFYGIPTPPCASRDTSDKPTMITKHTTSSMTGYLNERKKSPVSMLSTRGKHHLHPKPRQPIALQTSSRVGCCSSDFVSSLSSARMLVVCLMGGNSLISNWRVYAFASMDGRSPKQSA